jgi:AcrR family transcriptional regulator
MARRSDHSRDELRAMALKAGRDIVREEGVQKLTTRAVAKRIGYSVGTLYLIFKNADDLKFAINAGTLEELRNRLSKAVETITDPEQRLRSMAQYYLDYGLASPNLWRLMFEHQLPGDEPMPEVITQQTDALIEIISDSIQELVPAYKDNELKSVAAAFWAALHGIAHLVITDKLSLSHVESAHQVLDTQMQIFISGARRQAAKN